MNKILEQWFNEGKLTKYKFAGRSLSTARHMWGKTYILSLNIKAIDDIEKIDKNQYQSEFLNAYSASEMSAKIALNIEGYDLAEPDHHLILIQSLASTIKCKKGLIENFDECRRKRNQLKDNNKAIVTKQELIKGQLLAKNLFSLLMEYLKEMYQFDEAKYNENQKLEEQYIFDSGKEEEEKGEEEEDDDDDDEEENES